jgi:hypothetical protein
MGEKDAADELCALWGQLTSGHEPGPLTGFLSLHSGLPGPRANLTLAAEVDEDYLEQMEEWIRAGVKLWSGIMKENLGKARIAKKYPGRVAAMRALLG